MHSQSASSRLATSRARLDLEHYATPPLQLSPFRISICRQKVTCSLDENTSEEQHVFDVVAVSVVFAAAAVAVSNPAGAVRAPGEIEQ